MSVSVQPMSMLPTMQDLQQIQLIARAACASGLYNEIGGEAKILMIMLAARELGVGMISALSGGIYIVKGKVSLSSRCMNGMIRKAGHSIRVIRSDSVICTILGTRKDGDSFEASFSYEDAVKAGLNKGSSWQNYTEDMLYNRAMSRLARRLFADVISEAYIEGEIIEEYPSNKVKTNESYNIEVDDKKISSDQLQELMELIDQADESYKENLKKNMETHFFISEYKDLDKKYFSSTISNLKLHLQSKVPDVQTD